MPGELHGGWRTGDVKPDASPTSGATMDLEYGFSCMGYEVVAPWGAAMARAQTHPDGLVTALFGDGSYLMLNSELYSAAFAGHPYVAVVCDNGGLRRHPPAADQPGRRRVQQHARATPAARAPTAACRSTSPRTPPRSAAHVEDVRGSDGVEDLRAAYLRAREAARDRSAARPSSCAGRHPATWTEAGAWWETGVPPSLSGRAAYDEAKRARCGGSDADRCASASSGTAAEGGCSTRRSSRPPRASSSRASLHAGPGRRVAAARADWPGGRGVQLAGRAARERCRRRDHHNAAHDSLRPCPGSDRRGCPRRRGQAVRALLGRGA